MLIHSSLQADNMEMMNAENDVATSHFAGHRCHILVCANCVHRQSWLVAVQALVTFVQL